MEEDDEILYLVDDNAINSTLVCGFYVNYMPTGECCVREMYEYCTSSVAAFSLCPLHPSSGNIQIPSAVVGKGDGWTQDPWRPG